VLNNIYIYISHPHNVCAIENTADGSALIYKEKQLKNLTGTREKSNFGPLIKK